MCDKGQVFDRATEFEVGPVEEKMLQRRSSDTAETLRRRLQGYSGIEPGKARSRRAKADPDELKNEGSYG
jgi:hypothetical protein